MSEHAPTGAGRWHHLLDRRAFRRVCVPLAYAWSKVHFGNIEPPALLRGVLRLPCSINAWYCFTLREPPHGPGKGCRLAGGVHVVVRANSDSADVSPAQRDVSGMVTMSHARAR